MTKKYRILAILEGHDAGFYEAEAAAMAAMSGDQEPPDSDLLQMVEHVGVIEVKGRLTNSDSPYNKWYGMVSYNQIRAAAVEAQDLGAESLLFYYDTPGGAVAGMHGLAAFIDALEIPNVAYTDSTMASAGMFLAASSNNVFAGDLAETGSVGVVLTLVDQTEAMKKAGYSAEVIRSGKHKQAGNSMEKLTPENRKYITSQVDTYAEKFFAHISESRKMTRAAMDANEITTGRTYIGDQAISAGLVDRIMSFDEALAYTYYLGKKSIDESNNHSTLNSNRSLIHSSSKEEYGEKMKKTMSLEALAALAAGGVAVPDAAAGTDAAADAAQVEAEAAAAKILADAAAAKLAADADLQTQLDAAAAELVEKDAEIAKLKADAVTDQEAHAVVADGLKAILVGQVSAMRVGLKLAEVDMSAMAVGDVLREHKAVSASFVKAFPVGGVIPEKKEEVKKEAVDSREFVQSIAALGF